jgi:putative redox protein
MSKQLSVESLGGDRHRVCVRGHELIVDQPREDGGEDAGPTPVDLFVASLAACVSHYARRGLGRSGEGPTVRCRWTMSETPPWRVAAIDIDVNLPHDVEPARLAAVQRAVAHCTVHNTLVDPPRVRIRAAVPDADAFGSKVTPLPALCP